MSASRASSSASPSNAEIVTGGHEPDLPGSFFEPTVIAGLQQDDEMIQNEIFGPVMTVQRFDDEAKAISFGAALGSIPRLRPPPARQRHRFRLERSILRRWPKAAAVSRSSDAAMTPSGWSAGTMWTTADVTLGGGTKAERSTFIAIRGARAPLRGTARRP